MLTLEQAIKERHSVRSYTDKPLDEAVIKDMNNMIAKLNEEGGMNIQLVTNEPKAFDGFMAHYGKFSGVRNYIAVIGKKSADLEEKCGYYGEKLVLYAQQLGLNTCWVAMTYKKIKTAFTVGAGEKLCIVIALGYGSTSGVSHKSKPLSEFIGLGKDVPDWFKNGMNSALLAPTAMNQQKFSFTLNGNTVTAKAGRGFYTKIDLGIARYHFEIGAGKDNFKWANLLPSR